MTAKIIHIIWVGDDTKRPDPFIQTWRNLNPEWEVRVWGNSDYHSIPWTNKAKMEEMWHKQKELNGVADMMRWEILRDHGGFATDADAICIHPLEDWLFDAPMVVGYENEVVRPGLLSTSCMYAEPRHPLVQQIIEDIAAMTTVTGLRAWRTVGPKRLTDTYFQNSARYSVKILPSCHFTPRHLTGEPGVGNGTVYAQQYWGSTRENYEQLSTHVPNVNVNLNGNDHNIYFVHRLMVKEQRNLDRLTFFTPLVKGQKVLHVGFVDHPITMVPNNLHVNLAPHCSEIVGYDVNRTGSSTIEQHLPPNQRRMYFSLDEIGAEEFDWVLVPEVLQHVDNLKDFLTQISKIRAKQFAFSVIDAFALPHFYNKSAGDEVYEVAHPDQHCWFSPYALQSAITKYTSLKVKELHRINLSIVAICR